MDKRLIMAFVRPVTVVAMLLAGTYALTVYGLTPRKVTDLDCVAAIQNHHYVTPLQGKLQIHDGKMYCVVGKARAS